MSMARHLARGLRHLEREQRTQTFTYQNIEYPCTVGTETRGETLDLGGFEAEVALTIHVRRDVLPVVTIDSTVWADTIDSSIPAPNPGKRVTRKLQQYRIARVRADGSGAYWALDLVDPAK